MKIVVASAPVQADGAALEAALQLREAAGDGEVVVITLAPAGDREGLLGALAVGADRGVRLVHEAPQELDAIATARALAAAVRGEAPDLVLCGAGATGVALGALLGVARVAGVSRIEHDAGSDTATVERELEGGMVELIEVRLPAVLTVRPGMYKLRYTTLSAVRLALSKPVQTSAPVEIGAAAQIVSTSRARQDRQAQMIEGDATKIAERIAAIIRSEVV